MRTLTRIKTPRCLTPDHVVLLVALQLARLCRMCAAGTYLQDFDQDLNKKQVSAIIDYWVAQHGKETTMMHKLCDQCGEMESVDFMVRIDDNFYCTECDEEMEKEYENTNTKGKTSNENKPT